MTKFSIIMPIYNVEDYLERSIKSVLNQKYLDWELILVNDGSTDSSEQIAKKYAEPSDKIHLFNQVNMGSGKARQKGIENSIGEYICFIDPDDYLDSTALINNIEILEKFNPDILVNGYREISSSFFGKKSVREFVPSIEGIFNFEEFKDNFLYYKKIGLRNLWNKVYKRKFLIDNQIIFTSQPVGQDALFNYDAYKYIQSIYIDRKVYYNYDNSRKNSAVKTYRPNRAEYELNIATEYDKLMDKWGLVEEYSKSSALEYWKVVFIEIINLNNSLDSLKKVDKSTRINTLLKIPEIQKAISILTKRDIESLLSKICFILIKKNRIEMALNLTRLYLKVRY